MSASDQLPLYRRLPLPLLGQFRFYELAHLAAGVGPPNLATRPHRLRRLLGRGCRLLQCGVLVTEPNPLN